MPACFFRGLICLLPPAASQRPCCNALFRMAFWLPFSSGRLCLHLPAILAPLSSISPSLFLLARFPKFHLCVHRLQSSSHALCRITPFVATLLQRSGLRVPRPPVSTHALFHILPLVDSMFLQKDRLCAPCSHLAPVLYFA